APPDRLVGPAAALPDVVAVPRHDDPGVGCELADPGQGGAELGLPGVHVLGDPVAAGGQALLAGDPIRLGFEIQAGQCPGDQVDVVASDGDGHQVRLLVQGPVLGRQEAVLPLGQVREPGPRAGDVGQVGAQ